MHTAPIYKVQSDSKGLFILSCSEDRTAKLWDSKTGELIRTYRVPIDGDNDGKIYASTISPDDKYVLLGWFSVSKQNRSLYVLDFNSGEIVYHLKGIEDTVLDLEFSPDSKYLAVTWGANYEVLIFSTIDWKIYKKLSGFKKRVPCLSFDQSGRLVAISFDKQIKLYDSNFDLIKQRELPYELPISVDFTKDGSKIALAYYENNHVEVLNGSTLELEYSPNTTNNDSIGCKFERVCWSYDNKYLYSGGHCFIDISMDRPVLIRRWDNAGKGEYVDIPAGFNRLLDIESLPDNSIVYSGVQPEMGLINADTTLRFYLFSDILSFYTDDKEHLRINNNAKEVGFINSLNGLPYVFSIKDKRLFQKKYGLQAYNDNSDNLTVTDWLNSQKPKINDSLVVFKPSEYCRSVDISDDSKSVVLGTSWNLFCCDTLAKLKWKIIPQAEIWALNIAKNGKVIVATLGNGLINWYRLSDGKLLLSLFIHPDTKRWVLWTPNGFFTCSEGGDELIGWHVNDGFEKTPSFYPAKNFFDQYYRPDLIDEIFVNYETDEEIVKRKSATLIGISNSNLPPLVVFNVSNNLKKNEKEQGYTSLCQSLDLDFSFTDLGGGIDEIRVFQNGKLIESSQRGFKTVTQSGQALLRTIKIELSPGENLFTVTAFSKERVESNPLNLKVFYRGESAIPDLYILSIGINKYLNSKYNLNYAIDDAQSFLETVKLGASGVFRSVNAIMLQNEKVTKETIKNAFDDIISKIKPNDVFVFYFAGHGTMSEPSENGKPDFYLIPYDITQLYGDNYSLIQKGISSAELMDFSMKVKAQKQLFILDACQSGGAVEQFASRGAAEEKAIIQLARSTGVCLLSASSSEQFASEFKELGHGVFTYSILEGLKGRADGGLKDSKITVNELKAFIEDLVPELTLKYRGQSQFPTGSMRGQDFPIVTRK